MGTASADLGGNLVFRSNITPCPDCNVPGMCDIGRWGFNLRGGNYNNTLNRKPYRLDPYGTQANFHKEPPALRPPKVPMKAAMGLGFRD